MKHKKSPIHVQKCDDEHDEHHEMAEIETETETATENRSMSELSIAQLTIRCEH